MFKKGIIALALLTFSPVRAAWLVDSNETSDGGGSQQTIERSSVELPQLIVLELPYEWLL